MLAFGRMITSSPHGLVPWKRSMHSVKVALSPVFLGKFHALQVEFALRTQKGCGSFRGVVTIVRDNLSRIVPDGQSY